MTAIQTMKRISVLFAAIVAVSLLAMAGPLASPGNTQQADPPPPTLTGETLVATTLTGTYGPDQDPGEFTVTSVTCSEDGGRSPTPPRARRRVLIPAPTRRPARSSSEIRRCSAPRWSSPSRPPSRSTP